MEMTINGGVGGPVIVDGADGGGRGTSHASARARPSDVSMARPEKVGGKQMESTRDVGLAQHLSIL